MVVFIVASMMFIFYRNDELRGKLMVNPGIKRQTIYMLCNTIRIPNHITFTVLKCEILFRIIGSDFHYLSQNVIHIHHLKDMR